MKTTTNTHIIWTNDIDIDDWKEDIKACYPDEELTESELWNIANDWNELDFDDEKENLNKPLRMSLVMIGTLGLWDGTHRGWKHIRGNNLNDIFQGTCGDYVTWYVDENGDVCCEDIHHDGTNHYIYRAIKEDLTDFDFDEMMYDGKDIDNLTVKLGDYVADIYGFTKTWKEVK